MSELKRHVWRKSQRVFPRRWRSITAMSWRPISSTMRFIPSSTRTSRRSPNRAGRPGEKAIAGSRDAPETARRLTINSRPAPIQEATPFIPHRVWCRAMHIVTQTPLRCINELYFNFKPNEPIIKNIVQGFSDFKLCQNQVKTWSLQTVAIPFIVSYIVLFFYFVPNTREMLITWLTSDGSDTFFYHINSCFDMIVLVPMCQDAHFSMQMLFCCFVFRCFCLWLWPEVNYLAVSRDDGARSGHIITMNLKREDGNIWVNSIESLLGQANTGHLEYLLSFGKPLFISSHSWVSHVACLCRVCVCVCVYRRLKYCLCTTFFFF